LQKTKQLKKISICIPAYKRPENLQRLLISIAAQTFKDYEIIITDDSPDDSVKKMVDQFSERPISYFKNEKSLGTPANWNRAISLAKGEWIKLMHDDDWFRTENSLEQFAGKTKEGKNFVFSGFVTVFESGEEKESHFSLMWKKMIVKYPLTLLAQNVIGTPSVTLIHRSFAEPYDERMKWRVDIDYYIRLLAKEKTFALIEEPLVNVGMSEGQVTNYSINRPEFELPEGLLLLQKHGVTPLKQIIVYDAWWRILRNTGTRSKEQLNRYATYGDWPQAIVKMLNHQSKFSRQLLQIGPVSKMIMFFSYLLNRKYLHD
jgi:glycosyltransferase involved in cell wall biosynthesis